MKKIKFELTVKEIDTVLMVFNYALNTSVYNKKEEVTMFRVAEKFYEAIKLLNKKNEKEGSKSKEECEL